MSNRDIIVIGGSSGSLTGLREIVRSLPGDIEATIFITLHRGSSKEGTDPFPSLLSRRSQWVATVARDEQKFERRHIYIAPRQAQLTIERNLLRVKSYVIAYPPRSIDAMFTSAALTYGDRVIGVVLSGTMDDGTAGCWEIRKHGGVTIVQDPDEAPESSMPEHAMRHVPVHYCLPAAEIAVKLEELVAGISVPSHSQNARVLIVEDEWVLASELERQLGELRYTVVATVASGEEALKAAESAMPDVVIMDIALAGKLKGTDAAAHLWQRFEVPIIFLTAHADQETITAAQPAMPYAFLTKPHYAGQLHSAIKLALDRHRREIARKISN